MKADELMAIINGSNKKYYTYILSRPCGTPFYVGIGTGRRVLDHEIYARREAGHSRKLSIMRKIFREGYSIHYSIIEFHEIRESAANQEALLIRIIGRLDLGSGSLANATAGGEGVALLSNEARLNKSLKMKEIWLTRDKSKLAETLHSKELCVRAAAARLGQKRSPYIWTKCPGTNTPELRKAASERLKADPISKRPEVAAKISASKKGVPCPNHWTKDPAKNAVRGSHPRAVAVSLDGLEFSCIRDAAEYFGVFPKTIVRRIKNPHLSRRRHLK